MTLLLTTNRLVVRPWRDDDLPALAAIFADPEVMRFFVGTRDRRWTERWLTAKREQLDRTGYGILAVEAPGVAKLIGFVGLSDVPASFPCAPAVEAVWTFAAAHWRRGYATEAASEAMADGFGRCGLREIVAFTATRNTPSQRVMRALRMIHDPTADFAHPQLPSGHCLVPHVLYRKSA